MTCYSVASCIDFNFLSLSRNQHKFEQAAAMLTRKRGLAARVLDYAHTRAHIAGAVAHN